MNTKEFYTQFENLEATIQKLEQESDKATAEYKECKARTGQFDSESIRLGDRANELYDKFHQTELLLVYFNNLKTSLKKPFQVGVEGKSYFFVKKILNEDNYARGELIPSKDIGLYRSCPECNIEQPLLMKHNYGRHDGWDQQGFVLCEKDGVQKILAFISPDQNAGDHLNTKFIN